MIATSHPGRCGDAIFCLPTIKALCRKHWCKADMYSSDWCAPMEPLFRYQPFIRDFIIPPEYKIEGHGIGVQPWEMPIPKEKYEAVYQLGFKTYPFVALPDHIAASEGFGLLPLELEYPLERKIEGDYLVGCTKSMNECAMAFPQSPDFFEKMGERMRLVIIGMQPLAPHIKGEHQMMNMLEIASLMHFSRGFIGSPSTPHTIAAFIPHLKMVTLRHNWLDRRQMWQGEKQLVFDAPRADADAAYAFLGI